MGELDTERKRKKILAATISCYVLGHASVHRSIERGACLEGSYRWDREREREHAFRFFRGDVCGDGRLNFLFPSFYLTVCYAVLPVNYIL